MGRRTEKTEPQDLKCDPEEGCGKEFTRRVTIHKPSGEAGVTCPHCGKMQEPIPRD